MTFLCGIKIVYWSPSGVWPGNLVYLQTSAEPCVNKNIYFQHHSSSIGLQTRFHSRWYNINCPLCKLHRSSLWDCMWSIVRGTVDQIKSFWLPCSTWRYLDKQNSVCCIKRVPLEMNDSLIGITFYGNWVFVPQKVFPPGIPLEKCCPYCGLTVVPFRYHRLFISIHCRLKNVHHL